MYNGNGTKIIYNGHPIITAILNGTTIGMAEIVELVTGMMSITRNSKELSPLETYNFVSTPRLRRVNEPIAIKMVDTNKTVVSDFVGKVAGSNVENPNVAKLKWDAVLGNPTAFTHEIGEYGTDYSYISNYNEGSTARISTATNNVMSQQLFSFDIISIIERNGTKIPAVTTAEKVQWVKNNVTQLTCKWYGYGSCPNGNKAKLTVYDGNGWASNNWSHTSSDTSLIRIDSITSIASRIQSDGFIHFLAYTDPSNGTIPSTIYTDYVSLQVDYIETTQYEGVGVFGDTQTYTFDFGTKVAGSVAECPMKISRTYTSDPSVLSPPNLGTEVTSQVDLDKLKIQDGTTYNAGSASPVGAYACIGIELDLTPLCNSMYGGSNSALKSALKAIAIDCYAKGNGSDGLGGITYGMSAKIWSGTSWIDMYTNSSDTYVLRTTTITTSASGRVDSNNKLYVLLTSQYPIDSITSSTLFLDFIQIRIDLARTVDTVQPIPVNLSKNWAMLVRGYSPSWDIPKDQKYILSIEKDTNNKVLFDITTGDQIRLRSLINNTVITSTGTPTLMGTKYKIASFLIMKTATGYSLYTLFNNGAMEKVASVDGNNITGLCNLFMLRSSTGYYSDAFADSFTLLDLDKLGRPAGFTDSEALELLGRPAVSEIPYNPVTWGEWTKNNTTADKTGLTLNNTGGLSVNACIVSNTIKSNTKYGILYNIAYSAIANNKFYIGGGSVGTGAFTDTVSLTNVGNQKLILTSRSSGTSFFVQNVGTSNESIKIKDIRIFELPTGSPIESDFNNLTADQLNARYPFHADGVCYGLPYYQGNRNLVDMSKITLYASEATYNAGTNTVTLNATNAWHSSPISIPALPNNRYALNAILGQSVSYGDIIIEEYYNGILLGKLFDYTLTYSGKEITFTTGARTNCIKVRLTNSTAGTFTYKDITLTRKD